MRGAASVHPAAAAATSWDEDPPATAQSPPGLRQSVRGTHGTVSLPTTTTSARGTSSQRPAPGQSRSTGSDADAAPLWSTGGSSTTLSDHRSTGGPPSLVSSQPRSPASMSPAPTSPPGMFLPVEGGFPTYSNTTWGNPIAAAQSARKSSNSTSGTRSPASRSTVGADIVDGQAGEDSGRRNAEVGQEQPEEQNNRTGRGRRANRSRGRRGTARRTATAPAASRSASNDVAHPNVLDVTLPPGGPGEHWSNENVEW